MMMMNKIGNKEYTDEQMQFIEEYKEIIIQMQKYEELLYAELLKDKLNLMNDNDTCQLSENDQNFLFDYIFNDLTIINDKNAENL